MTEILLTTIILLLLVIKKDTFDLHAQIRLLQKMILSKVNSNRLQDHGLSGGILRDYPYTQQDHIEKMQQIRKELLEALEKQDLSEPEKEKLKQGDKR